MEISSRALIPLFRWGRISSQWLSKPRRLWPNVPWQVACELVSRYTVQAKFTSAIGSQITRSPNTNKAYNKIQNTVSDSSILELYTKQNVFPFTLWTDIWKPDLNQETDAEYMTLWATLITIIYSSRCQRLSRTFSRVTEMWLFFYWCFVLR